MLVRNSTWTFSRDVDLKFTFTGVNYYDGQGFMVSKDLGVTSAKELDGATVCIQTGTTTELNLADWFKANGMSYQPVPIQTNAEADQQFQAGACDAYTTDASGLAASRATYEDPSNWVILPEIISKEPLGPLVRQGDDQWADIVRWTLNALIAAEEYGVTTDNVEDMAQTSENPEVRRLLGTEGDLGAMFGLDKDWAKRAIKARGNYGEIFAANIGEGTASDIAARAQRPVDRWRPDLLAAFPLIAARVRAPSAPGRTGPCPEPARIRIRGPARSQGGDA